MGRGIAHMFSFAGHRVTLSDFKPRTQAEYRRRHEEALAEVGETLQFFVRAGLLSWAALDDCIERIDFATGDAAMRAIGEADIIFEAIPERLEEKQQLLARISAVAGRQTTIASTTSTILVDALADVVSNPERFLNAHFLNPAFLIPLVEVSPGHRTHESVTESLETLLRSIGKVPVRCAPAPGFIVPRIQAAAMAEAARIVEEGVASAEDVDRAIQVGFGPRYTTMGLVEFIDWGGVDILYHACNYLNEALATERFTAPEGVVERMNDGRRGLREGEGYYDYSNRDVDAYREAKLTSFVELLNHLKLLPASTANR